ncbi:hypothetical protein OOU_Y34scaffold00126g82 [Pyricularia oryzae Y34]|nr:hypothetical protein OOU_Y34scaffold00126g82 [Pyricularia oryzae Y34]
MSASFAPECNEVKERYDTCFLKWYSEKYLRGAGTSNKNECESLFNDYQKCLGVALKKKGIDKLLDEAREDNKENDATHMGRRWVRSSVPIAQAQLEPGSISSTRDDTKVLPLVQLLKVIRLFVSNATSIRAPNPAGASLTTPGLDSSSSSEQTIPAVARANVALPTVSLPAASRLPRVAYTISVCGYTTLVAEASGQIQFGPAMRH